VVRELAELIERRGIDVVMSFLIHANAVAAGASLMTRGVRYIQSIQTTQARPRWHWTMQRLVHRRAEVVVVPSESVAEAAREWSNIPREKIRVIPNAIEVADYAEVSVSPIEVKAGQAFPIGFIGRLDPIKCVPDLVEAVLYLGGLAQLHIFGEGPDRQAIEAAARRYGVERLVTLHGAVQRPQEALRGMGLLVLPSRAEGFGLVLIEAMAARVPVVATDVPGIRNVVRHGETGLLVPHGDARALALAIDALIRDRALRERLIEGALEDVQRRFSWTGVIEQYHSILQQPVD
jgi:glycogen synthase